MSDAQSFLNKAVPDTMKRGAHRTAITARIDHNFPNVKGTSSLRHADNRDQYLAVHIDSARTIPGRLRITQHNRTGLSALQRGTSDPAQPAITITLGFPNE